MWARPAPILSAARSKGIFSSWPVAALVAGVKRTSGSLSDSRKPGGRGMPQIFPVALYSFQPEPAMLPRAMGAMPAKLVSRMTFVAGLALTRTLPLTKCSAFYPTERGCQCDAHTFWKENRLTNHSGFKERKEKGRSEHRPKSARKSV